MFRLLIFIKCIVYLLVFYRIFSVADINVPLIVLAITILVSGFLRSAFEYTKPKVNIITLILDLFLAILLSFFSQSGSFDKLFIVYLTEGTAILPKPYFMLYGLIVIGSNIGSTAVYGLRETGKILVPEIADLLLLGFVFALILSERRQREQRLSYQKLTEELRYVNHQLKESMSLTESLASEAERRRIAGEIHDNLGHNLTGLILTLEAGKRVMGNNLEEGKTYWDKALLISRSALHAVRELVSVMKESSPEFELVPKLEQMAREVWELTGLILKLDIQTHDICLSAKEQFNIYRIFQEAVTNTLRHANSSEAQISMVEHNKILYFSYSDNGIGTNRIVEGNGLTGIKERIHDLKGTIFFYSQAGHGFRMEGSIDKRGIE